MEVAHLNAGGRRSSRARAFVRAAGKHAARAYGLGSAPLRPRPDFVIIGAKRCGTTSLFRYLGEHPGVLPLFPSAARLPLADNQKGVHYFDTGAHHSLWWYRSFFPTEPARWWRQRHVGGNVVTGEASPYYLWHPLAPARAAAAIPAARLIVLLRDPVDRTWSHFREQRRNGVEELTFEEAIDAEAARTANEEERLTRDPRYVSFPHEHQSYVAQSEYERGLRRWFDRYAARQLLVLRSEDLYLDPQGVYDRVVEFLDIAPFTLPRPTAWNAAPKHAMSSETRARLLAHFRPHNAELAALLGYDLGWDATP